MSRDLPNMTATEIANAWPESFPVHGIIGDMVDREIGANNLRNERIIRKLLGRWVSELEPAVAYRNGEIIGLTIADALVGSQPFVLAVD